MCGGREREREAGEREREKFSSACELRSSLSLVPKNIVQSVSENS